MSSGFPLYWFQKEAKDSALDALRNGKNSVLISAPTGAGKTIIFSSFLEEATAPSNLRSLIMVHRDTLLEQTIEKLNLVWPGTDIGRIKGREREYDKRVIVASVPTLANRIEEFIESFSKYGPIAYAVIDEAHHSLAPMWTNIYRTLRRAGTKFLGVTATPLRTRKDEHLSTVFEDVVYSISVFRLIHEGYLSPLIGYSVQTSLSLKGVKITKGDYNINDLADRIRGSNFNEQVVQVWKEKAQDRRTICFAINISHVDSLTESFIKAGARAVGIHGEIPVPRQREILKDFAEGNYDVLVNCMLLTEGFDEPSLDCVLMARPTTSRTLYVQMIGRGLRVYPGKSNCLLIDFVSNSRDNSLVTMQDLLGFYGMQKAEEIYKKNLPAEYGSCAKSAPFEISPESIPGLQAIDTFGEELQTSMAYREIDVFDLNKFAWTKMNGSYYVTAREALSIAVHKEEEKYVPYLIFSGQEGRCVAKISEPVDREIAFAIANVYLFDYGNRRLMSEDQAWRDEEPTPSQRVHLTRAIERYKAWFREDVDIALEKLPDRKGAYSDALTAIYGSNYIKSTRIPRIRREEATEKLKMMVLREMNLAVDSNKLDPTEVRLTVSGEYTAREQEALTDMIIFLGNDRHGEYSIKFLMENQIYFTNDSIKVISPVPITDKQYSFLMDKVNSVFRLFFRNKRFVIEAPEIIKKLSREAGMPAARPTPPELGQSRKAVIN